ncbi:MAG: hypothetical protein L7U25_02395 [Candidatus Poseidonia sp.]|nr:hypothetical protein [Poseidonia sp.]
MNRIADWWLKLWVVSLGMILLAGSENPSNGINAAFMCSCGMFLILPIAMRTQTKAPTLRVPHEAGPTSGPAPHTMEAKINQARQLEKAKEYARAAKAYYDLGMFPEAARAGKLQMEIDPSTTIYIGSVGDTIIQDSVVMNDQERGHGSQCKRCGQSVQSDWSTCPFCTSPL